MLPKILLKTGIKSLFVPFRAYNWKGQPEIVLSLVNKADTFYKLADKMTNSY